MQPERHQTNGSVLAWKWPLPQHTYDTSPLLSFAEQDALNYGFSQGPRPVTHRTKTALSRVLQPIHDVLAFCHASTDIRYDVVRFFLQETYWRQRSFWGWSVDEWVESLGEDIRAFTRRFGRPEQAFRNGNLYQARRCIPVVAYLLCSQPDDYRIWTLFKPYALSRRLFGEDPLTLAVQRLSEVLHSWGYEHQSKDQLLTTVCWLFLWNRSPGLESLTTATFETVAIHCTAPSVQQTLFRVSRVLAHLGIIDHPLAEGRKDAGHALTGVGGSVDPGWMMWCQRWRKQTTMQERDGYYYPLLKVGRWLKVHHPTVTSPMEWTYDLAMEFVTAVCEMKVGEWSEPQLRSRLPAERLDHPLLPTTKNRVLEALRTFFRDCQEWNWIPIQFNPQRALRTPRAMRNLLGPNPRVIDRELWAKLLWAAMNLGPADLPVPYGQKGMYPIEMIRALAVVWCFTALRANEIRRLRVGCIRWQHEDVLVPETGIWLPKDAVCFLDIPVNKTSSAYTKAVHPLVGKRIQEWEQVRPQHQPKGIDAKTGEYVPFLFAYRGKRISDLYLNEVLIPALCRKAGTPEEDSRGTITSHRARATIASMLYNAKEPLTIFELKEYLGHKHLYSTQHYVKVDPTKLASRVAQANYLEQNLATVEVLLDQEAVLNGAAARGELWKYYDLGHGFCTNTFWAECRHRMACARCSFYRPKMSTRDQLVEGKANLVHMLEYVKLTDDERLFVTDGIDLHQTLIDRLVDVPTPAGPTPRELSKEPSSQESVIPLHTIRSQPKWKTNDVRDAPE